MQGKISESELNEITDRGIEGIKGREMEGEWQ